MLGATTAMPRRLNATGHHAIHSVGLKILALCLLVTLSCPIARSQDALRIESIGLGGYYSTVTTVPVLIHLPALSESQSLRLEFTVRSSYIAGARDIVRTDRFFKTVSQLAGHASDVEVPVLITDTPIGELEVTAATPDGRVVGSAKRDFKSLQSISQNQYLVAVYCQDNATCASVDSQIEFHGKGVPGTAQRVTSFSAPRQHWWSYSPARAIVLAGPVTSLTQNEREALEDYARAGGILVILEDEVADKAFLAPYRAGTAASAPTAIGRGQLYRLRSVASKELAQQSFENTFSKVGTFAGYLTGQLSDEPLLNRVGVFFTFPRLRWLIIWLAAYLLVVGPLNFFLLRRAKKLEWGWLTTCLLALLFAASLYFSSSSHRPRDYTLDTVTAYWMDCRSPVAVEDVGLRISSPHRGDVSVSVNDDVIAVRSGNLSPGGPSDVEVGADVTDKQRIQEGWNLEVGPPVTATTTMLRWSTADFRFEGFRELAGSVHWISPNKFRNETGISFREAVYLDYPANRRYFFPHVGAGEEVDLAALSSTLIWKEQQIASGIVKMENRDMYSPPQKGAFAIVDFPYVGFQTGSANHVFAGLSDAPLPAAQLQIPATSRAKVALTIVSMDEK